MRALGSDHRPQSMTTGDEPWWDPRAASILPGEVHVWRAPLDRPAGEVRDLEGVLSPDEHRRAAGYCFDRDRRRFMVAHGLLRHVVGRYTGIAPERLAFANGLNGKPRLTGGRERTPLHVNLSHSDELALFAVAADREVGIDVERIRLFADVEGIASSFLTSGEYAALAAQPLDRRDAAFFSYWTCKEAYVKGLGEGLSWPLNRFEVQFLPDRRVRIVAVRSAANALRPWSLVRLDVGLDYEAALAVAGHGWKLRIWSLP
jgi:4'-phosphopantetheinyl transferase